MTTTIINRSKVFSTAWAIVRTELVTISQGLKKAWAIAKSSVEKVEEKIETFYLETKKYAGKMAYGFKDCLIGLWWKDRENGILVASYGDVSYDNYRHGKQNSCTMTVESGAAIENGEILLGLAEKWLTEAKEVKGETFSIKGTIKKFGFSWDGTSKSWKK